VVYGSGISDEQLSKAKAFSGYGESMLILNDDGTVEAVGANTSNKLGTNTTDFELTNAEYVSAGESADDADGQLSNVLAAARVHTAMYPYS
jgi:hypothetical protein